MNWTNVKLIYLRELRDQLRAIAGAAPTLPRAVGGRRRRTNRVVIAAVAAVTAVAAPTGVA